MALGVLGFMNGVGMKSELAGVLLIGGIFLFGCGLVAAAIGARK